MSDSARAARRRRGDHVGLAWALVGALLVAGASGCRPEQGPPAATATPSTDSSGPAVASSAGPSTPWRSSRAAPGAAPVSPAASGASEPPGDGAATATMASGAARPTAPPSAGAAAACRVAAVGDSLTDPRALGVGGHYLTALASGWRESEAQLFGVGGQMANQIRRRFERDLFDAQPDNPRGFTHVIVFAGVNDLYSDETAGRTPAKVEADLAAMYDAARRRGVRVVAMTVAPWGGFTRYHTPKRQADTLALNEWIRGQDGVTVDAVVDAYALLSCGDPERLCPEWNLDGIHFGKAGHERLAAALADVIRCR